MIRSMVSTRRLLCKLWLLMYTGAPVILQRTEFWNLRIISLFELTADPHSGIAYAHMGQSNAV